MNQTLKTVLLTLLSLGVIAFFIVALTNWPNRQLAADCGVELAWSTAFEDVYTISPTMHKDCYRVGVSIDPKFIR
jgi:hypothetical protein